MGTALAIEGEGWVEGKEGGAAARHGRVGGKERISLTIL